MRTFLTFDSPAFEILVNEKTRKAIVHFIHSGIRHVGEAVTLDENVYVTALNQQFVAQCRDAYFYR